MSEIAIMKSGNSRSKLMRRDTSEILTRLFFLQRSLVISQAGWIVRTPRLEDKALLAKFLWEDSLIANQLRNRVFELRYPRRDINLSLHRSVISLFDAGRNAPSLGAFVAGMAKALKPAIMQSLKDFHQISDRISDGPTELILRHAMADLSLQIDELNQMLEQMIAEDHESAGAIESWTQVLRLTLDDMGGDLLNVDCSGQAGPASLPDSIPFTLPKRPARDRRFINQRFYYPHIVDPSFPSGDGIYLQLRSAIGHLNEAWAAEAAAAALYSLADELEWEYIVDVARWTYDESRHCLMGYQRLLDWGYQPEALPMGDYIYTTANEYGPLYMLGMLHYFETKFIHRGRERIETFTSYHDDDSRHDYEFDWADETFHAEYGRRWIEKLLAKPDMPAKDVDELRQQCEEYLQETIASATQAEQDQIVVIAEELIARAEARIS